MVKLLIKLFASLVAGRVERGSTVGAIVGTLLGFIIGMALAHVLLSAGWFGRDYAVACYLIGSVPLAILGALIGAAVGPRRSRAEARIGVRLTRYNQAAGSLAIALFFLALIIAAVVLPDGKNGADPTPKAEIVAIGIVIVVLFLAAAFRAIREVWYADLGPMIFVRRLVGSRSYTRHDLQLWGFEIRPNEMIQKTFVGNLDCYLRFNDGYICRVSVRGEDSQAIVDLLGQS